ncbi:MAG: type II CRISPR RNA-guided endonuclease Cas9 [Arcobacteraceae bacterium]|nr:type II CRISPR RNA-guided endonuclease Cas9 [Arcobacteraceae bacterium]
MKKILSLDLGVTSVGYSVLENIDSNRYKLLDYGVSMFDKPTDKDGNSKKLLHSASVSQTKLYNLRKLRKQNLAKLFEEFGFGNQFTLLKSQRENQIINKWELRGKAVFERKLNINELFAVLYLIAKYRGYKSLDSGDLLEELCEDLDLECSNPKDKEKKDDEKGKIKQALKTVEYFKQNNSSKTVAQIIYELEIKKATPVFRNHDNYNYMIRREYINEEIESIIESQKNLGFFASTFNIGLFIKRLKETIDDQKESTTDLSLFGQCEFYKDFKVAHQYSLLTDIFKMYQSVANIIFNQNIKITKEQIKLIGEDFFLKIKEGKNIPDIKYKDIRKILNLKDEIKIFNKDDERIEKGKKVHNTIIKFHFVNNLSKFGDVFNEILDNPNKYEILKEIFDTLKLEKSPKNIYEKLNNILEAKTIIELIKNKSGSSINISHEAMIQFIPYFEDGFTLDDIKQKLDLSNEEDYSKFPKGIKYLHISQFELDNNLSINNHPVKSTVSAVLRLVKHLHVTYGVFDEIKVESTRELSQNDETRKEIEKVNRDNESKFQAIIENQEYQAIANLYGKNIKKYARKILMWQEQEFLDIYSGAVISVNDIFTNVVDIDHIVPQSLGGLSVKHNLVLAHRDTNLRKSNILPLDFISNKQSFINRVEKLFTEHKINFKKRKNLLASNLDEVYKDTFESKSLRATSYIEALTAQILKRYYPFQKSFKNVNNVSHIQGRATSNVRKVLQVKTKTRDTNIHHAIDAVLIGLIDKSWLQKLSNTFKENFGKIDNEARENIKKTIPLIEGIEPKELVDMIENKYNEFEENSVFYKDIFGKTKVVNFWISKKPMSSKMHNDTIYAKKDSGYFTVRKAIIPVFVSLDIKITTTPQKFEEVFKKEILDKLYLYHTNPKDVICQIIINRANEIKSLLQTFQTLDMKDKETISEAKIKLEELIHSPLVDQNKNMVRKVQFAQTNLTGFEIRGGIATKEKTFIGFSVKLLKNKLEYERIDISNYSKIKAQNDNSFKVYKNEIVFFVGKNGEYKGGKIVSFLEDSVIASFQNPKFPSAIKLQPEAFCTMKKGKDGKPEKGSTKQHYLATATGIIKLNLDILGNIISYKSIGIVDSELLEFIKSIKG